VQGEWYTANKYEYKMSDLNDFNKDMDELDDIERAFGNSKNWNAQDDFDLAHIDGSFDKPLIKDFGGCSKFFVTAFVVTLSAIVLFFVLISILGSFNKSKYEYPFMEIMEKQEAHDDSVEKGLIQTQPSEWQPQEEGIAKTKQSKVKQTRNKRIKVSPLVREKQE
jgi:hypothetical protein